MRSEFKDEFWMDMVHSKAPLTVQLQCANLHVYPYTGYPVHDHNSSLFSGVRYADCM